MDSKNIYLVCNATSVNQIINSINNIKDQKKDKDKSKSIFSSFMSLFKTQDKKKDEIDIKNISNEEFSNLDIIGIIEADKCKNNEHNKEIFEKVINKDKNIYTSLDLNSIETSFILFNTYETSINLLPYMSDQTNIKDDNSYNKFKNILVNSKESKNDITKLKNYWNSQKLSNNFLSIKNVNCFLNWKYINNIRKNELNTYRLEKFQKKLIDIIKEKNNINEFIIICNPKMILDLLNKSTKKIKINSIENTSIWKLNIQIDNKNKNINITKIIFKDYDKLYPTDYNPVNKKIFEKNDNLTYLYNGNKFKLFDGLKNIPLNYLEILEFKRFSAEKRKQISQILNRKKLNKTNNKINNKTNNKTNKKINNKTIYKENNEINIDKIKGIENL